MHSLKLTHSLGDYDFQLHLTTGDVDGIGLEITLKTVQEWMNRLNNHDPFIPDRVQLMIWCHETSKNQIAEAQFHFDYNVLDTADDLQKDPQKRINFIISHHAPASWVEQAAHICLKSPLTSALVTAPLSKVSMHQSGYLDLGHTPLLARISGSSSLRMGFIGNHFSILLHSDHIPLGSVAHSLNQNQISATVAAARELRAVLGSQLPIGWLGVNPHAGEEGLIGKEDIALQDMLKSFEDIKSGLVPDASFHQSTLKNFSLLVANYHDQGLIPFKLVHGFDDGVHMTLNLPFVRTSVDHGTAKDIFGQGIANHHSMLQATLFAYKLLKVRNENA